MSCGPNIIDFASGDSRLLGLSVSLAQETLLRSIYGLPLNGEQLDLWRLSTGRDRYPGRPFAEVTVIAGARSGKDSRIGAPVLCYEAAFGGHEKQLGRGERAVIPLRKLVAEVRKRETRRTMMSRTPPSLKLLSNRIATLDER